MPTLVNYCGDDKHHTGGSLCSMNSNRLFSILDVYNHPCKRSRINDSYSLFSNNKNNPSIEILPDECLYEIFRRLSGGKGRSVAACVSLRWLTLISNLKASEIIVSNKVKVKVNNEFSYDDEQENDGYLTRSLEGKKATDTRLAAIAVGTSARGGLGKLSVRGSDKVTSIGFSAIARGCPNLRVLSLWNVPMIGDESLIEISKCQFLESLDLCHCPLISNIGLISIAKNCPNLSSLTIESCKNIGNKSLQTIARCCPNLQSLTIKDCPNVGDQGVATLFSSSLVLTKVKLQSLDITDLSLAVIGRYGKSITNLALTNLRNVSQKGFWAMGNAGNLESLMSLTVISCCGITDLSLKVIGKGCHVLKHLVLKKCWFLSDKGLVSFARAARFLESLQLEECNRVTQQGILGTLSNQNSKMKSFSVVKCMGVIDLDEKAIDFFEKNQSLHSLTIKNCIGFGNKNLEMIGKLSPNLHNLDLTGLSGITDSGLFDFLKTRTAGLKKINLTDCINLTDKVVVDLVKIHGGTLELLNLGGCRKITDESMAAIGRNCGLLKDLDVSKSGITDSGVSWLCCEGNMRLRVLALSGCMVSNEIRGLGVNWGTRASHPLSPNIVVKLMKDNGFDKVKLFEAEPRVLDALRNSGLQVMLGIPNDFLAPLASGVRVAEDWVAKNVSAYVSRGVDIRYVAVGNEPFLKTYKNMFTNATLPALQNIQAALIKAGLGSQVKITVPLNADVYESNSGVPSEGNFRSDIHSLMISIVQFLSDNAAPLTINIYPFLSLYADPHFPIDFAFFAGTNAPVVDGTISYTNVFDANYDTLVWALEKNGFPAMPVIVGEIGWPTDGDQNANLGYARKFNQGLISRIIQGQGTPKRKTPPDVYIFGLIDEDQKSIDPAKGVRYLSRQWCVMAEGASESDPNLADSVKYACTYADCTSLGYGSSCNGLDARGNASYAFNQYFQTFNQQKGTCDFHNLSVVTKIQPTTGMSDCKYEIMIDLGKHEKSRNPVTSVAAFGWRLQDLSYSGVVVVMLSFIISWVS
ncbi:unnamed protein product [Lactuca virosa]|uniref:glucan endo-1,3-beta-D-glucosidase n=1 Tax=Lactuca virosa TaxID=75947 RepID=A0AAU9PH87_9ASTR|nr:unnamed protein product [Lactuca virosa]